MARGDRESRLAERGREDAETIALPDRLARKRPFDITEMLDRIEAAVELYPKAMLFELASRGFRSAFEQLLACVISIRTLDETSLEVALRFFARARTAAEVAKLGVEEIDRLLAPATFHRQKAERFLRIAEIVVENYDGSLPCEREALLALPGVGPKCAALVLGVACDKPEIGVDIHVHRVTNRWGYVEAPSPERTELALRARLPRSDWVRINALLVPFGKHICTGRRPRCSDCPVLEYCHQLGVEDPR